MIKMKTKFKMRFISLLAAAAAAVLPAAFGIRSAAAAEREETFSSSGLGYSVNVPCGGFYGGKPEGEIFDNGFLSEKLNAATRLNINKSTVSANSFFSYDGVLDEYKRSCGIKNGDAVYKIEAAAILNGTINFTAYPYHYFYFRSVDAVRYSLSLPSYLSQLSEYAENLGADYTAALESYFEGGISAESLFSKYGTHVVMKGCYGKKWLSLCSAVSSVTDLSKYKSELEERACSALDGNVFDTLSLKGVSVPATEVNISSLCFPRADTYSEFAECGSVLTGSTSDGLVPLWELLPDKWKGEGYAGKLKTDYEKYASGFKVDEAELLKSHAAAELPEKPSEEDAANGNKNDEPVKAEKGLSGLALGLVITGAVLCAAAAAVLIVFAVLGRKKGAPEHGEDGEETNSK